VITKRRLMTDYALKGIYPLVPLITTTSEHSPYLKGRSADFRSLPGLLIQELLEPGRAPGLLNRRHFLTTDTAPVKDRSDRIALPSP
jgi:hypothetical protein